MIDLDRIFVTITPVDHLRSNGFSLSLNDRGALVVAPAARLDDAARAYIRQHLDEIKSALSAEESQYWAAYQRGAEIAAAADVAQACVVGATKTESEAHSALRQTREQLTQLRTDPSRHGARMTRREIEAEIAAEERNERRALIFLEAIRTHVARHQADLQRLMGQCALETRTLNAFTDQYEAVKQSIAQSNIRTEKEIEQ